MFEHKGNCPRCGAPVYAKQYLNDRPTAYFTCDCRLALPTATIATVGADDLEATTTEADQAALGALRDEGKPSEDSAA